MGLTVDPGSECAELARFVRERWPQLGGHLESEGPGVSRLV
jgi:hypothetical protein